MSKKVLTPRPRGTPSPGSQPNHRISPHRGTTTNRPSTASSIHSHRRAGSGTLRSSRPLGYRSRDPVESDNDARVHEDFLSNSSGYPLDREDNEVYSIYRDSLDPRERSSIESLVNQQKKDAGFTSANGSGVATSLMSSSTPVIAVGARKTTQRAPFGSFKPTQQTATNITEPDNISDTPTEVESYNSPIIKLSQSSRARPGPQRAILEIASTMERDDIAHVIEILSMSLKESTGRTTPQQRLSPRGQAQNNPRRSKSGPPALVHGPNGWNDDDIEVQHHNHVNETCRLIPPVSSVPHATHTRPLSTTPTPFRLSGSTPNTSPDMVPIDFFSKKSPVPTQCCPTVDRKKDDIVDETIPTAWSYFPSTSGTPPAPADTHGNSQDTEVPSRVHNRPHVPPLDLPSLPPRNRSYESIHSPRSAFDDCSVGSSGSAFTETSRRSSLNRGTSGPLVST